MTLQELWREVWSEWLSAAFPLVRFIPLVVFVVGAYFLGSYGYTAVQESKNAVVEVVTETSHKLDNFIKGTEASSPSEAEVSVHVVGQETDRVLRI